MSIRQTLDSIIPLANSCQNGSKEKSQYEIQSHEITQSRDLWNQFQAEVRANNISTAAGVKEMLKQKHVEQQKLHAASAASLIDVAPVKESRSMSLFGVGSSSAALRRYSIRASSTDVRGIGRNESFDLVRPRKQQSNFFESVGEDNDRNYRQAIRGNTESFLSLYGNAEQVSKSPSSNRMASLSSASINRRPSILGGFKTTCDKNESFEFIQPTGRRANIFDSIIEDRTKDKHPTTVGYLQSLPLRNNLDFHNSLGTIESDILDLSNRSKGLDLSSSNRSTVTASLAKIEPQLDILLDQSNISTLAKSLAKIDSMTEIDCPNSSLNNDESFTALSNYFDETGDFLGQNDNPQEIDGSTHELFSQEETSCELSDDDDGRRNNGCFEFPSDARLLAFERTGVFHCQCSRSTSISVSRRSSITGSLTSLSTLLVNWDGTVESSLLVGWGECDEICDDPDPSCK